MPGSVSWLYHTQQQHSRTLGGSLGCTSTEGLDLLLVLVVFSEKYQLLWPHVRFSGTVHDLAV